MHCDWPNLKREMEMLHYSYRIVRHDVKKPIKPITNEAFVVFSEGIITDCSDSYGLFRRCVASRHVNITMSSFVIGETTNNKHYTTLFKTHV